MQGAGPKARPRRLFSAPVLRPDAGAGEVAVQGRNVDQPALVGVAVVVVDDGRVAAAVTLAAAATHDFAGGKELGVLQLELRSGDCHCSFSFRVVLLIVLLP